MEGARIVIFAEGSSEQVRYIRSFKTGMARMAYDAYEKDNNANIAIVPVGVSFEDFQGFRKDAYIKVGKPIQFNDYLEQFEENYKRGIRKLSKDSQAKLDELIINVPDDEILEPFEQAAEVCTNEWRRKEQWLPIFDPRTKPLERLQKLAKKVKSEIETGSISKTLKDYKQLLTKAKLKDEEVLNDASFIMTLLKMLLLIPFALMGVVFNFIPTGIVTFLTEYYIPRNRFYTSLSGLSRLLVHYYLFYPIVTIILIFKFGWIGILFAPVAVITEWLLFRFLDQVRILISKIKLLNVDANLKEELKTLRNEIKEKLEIQI